ncbi:LptA/OstA family protein [Asticcacaulis benevestitus]|uniref:Organic solvent tolerance-like N-terminal domain-containing protein n=1 Tax=Asticcacaulis benevestitus DSM 16100 = ATCC BAA-896 TaxID=1121022 RepID=V4RGC7_9CAUL|nr:LptA/OstA family protein [Asticcacaulis benevestitus]ESQ90403.1 hypothetical protein ABENE_12495 [Asticcacaulis benevestitus DSM 16100 = ATCC BAA-896]
MKTHKVVAVLAAVGLGFGLSGAVQAQVSGQGGPVMVGGDAMHLEENTHTQVWNGRVEVKQDDARLRADNIRITFAPGDSGSGFGPVQVIEATGNVYYVTTDNTIKSDQAVYTKSADNLIFTGQVILTQKQNVMTGSRLVYQVTNKVTNFDNGNGRVKAIIYPDKKPAQ